MAKRRSGTNDAAGAISGLDKVLKEFAASVTVFSGAMQKTVQTAFLPLTTALGTFEVACSKTIQTLKGFVEKANPAAAFQFNRALDDLAGTMGQILTPILNAVTGYIREQADVLQGMRTALAPVIEAFSSIVTELSKTILPTAELLLPTFQSMGFVIKEVVVPAIKLAVEALTALADVAKAFGFAQDIQKSSSVGAAVRPAAYSKVEDIGKRTTLAALQSQGGSSDPQKQAVEEQKKANVKLDAIEKGITKLAELNVRPISWAANKLLSVFD